MLEVKKLMAVFKVIKYDEQGNEIVTKESDEEDGTFEDDYTSRKGSNYA